MILELRSLTENSQAWVVREKDCEVLRNQVLNLKSKNKNKNMQGSLYIL